MGNWERFEGGGGGWTIADYMGRLHLKGVHLYPIQAGNNKRVGISKAEEKKRVGKRDLWVFKRDCIEMHCVYCGYTKGGPFAMEGTRYMYMKGLPFLSRMVYKR